MYCIVYMHYSLACMEKETLQMSMCSYLSSGRVSGQCVSIQSIFLTTVGGVTRRASLHNKLHTSEKTYRSVCTQIHRKNMTGNYICCPLHYCQINVHITIIICYGHCLATKAFIGKLPATKGTIGKAHDERGHGQQNSFKILIGLHSTMHLIHPN